jgi:uncharacterized protein (TIGR00369 family)
VVLADGVTLLVNVARHGLQRARGAVTKVARRAGHNRNMTAPKHAPHAPSPKSERRSALDQSKLETAIQLLTEQQITFNQTLGLRVMSQAPSDMRVDFTMRPALVGHYQYGRLHGGVISATLDTTGGFGLMVALGEKHPEEAADQVMHRFAKMATVDLRVDYLRAGIGKVFTASVVVTRLGGRIGSTQMRLVNDEGLLIATGNGTYVVS